jgi:hypothetical protein
MASRMMLLTPPSPSVGVAVDNRPRLPQNRVSKGAIPNLRGSSSDRAGIKRADVTALRKRSTMKVCLLCYMARSIRVPTALDFDHFS